MIFYCILSAGFLSVWSIISTKTKGVLMKKRLGNFGEQIKRIRRQKKWTQEQLAEKVNISPTYLGMIERGEKIPSFFTFVELVVCLEASADEILFGDAKVDPKEMMEKIEELSDSKRYLVYQLIDGIMDM